MNKTIHKKADELIKLLKANNYGGVVIVSMQEELTVRTCGNQEVNPEIGIIIEALKKGTNIYDVPTK